MRARAEQEQQPRQRGHLLQPPAQPRHARHQDVQVAAVMLHFTSCHVMTCHVLHWSSQMMLAITEIGSYQFLGDYYVECQTS